MAISNISNGESGLSARTKLNQAINKTNRLGKYDAGVAYEINDFIWDAGIKYKSLQVGNTNHTPASSPTWWEIDSSSNSIETDTTFYVDGDTGDNANDGLTWGTALKNLDLLDKDSIHALPREINAAVTINVRGTVLSTGTAYHTHCDYFKGSGYIRIEGVETIEASGIVTTGQQNDEANLHYHNYLDASAEAWTVDEHAGRYVRITAGLGASSGIVNMYPILSNTATRIETVNLPDIDGTSVFDIISIPQLKGATIADPSTLVNYSRAYGYDITQNKINIQIYKIDFSNVLSTNVKIEYYNNSLGCSNYCCNFKQFIQGTASIFQTVFGRCNTDFPDYSWLQSRENPILIDSSIISSNDNTGYGCYMSTGGNYRIYTSRIVGQVLATSSEGSGKWELGNGNHFENCGEAINPQNADIIISAFGPCHVYMDNVGTGINMSGSSFFVGNNLTVVHQDVTIQIKVSDEDGDTALFTDIETQKTIQNTATGASVVYVNNSTYKSIQNPEYDNTTSGLNSHNFQGAIDALANGSAKNIVTVINNTGGTLTKGKIIHPIGESGGMPEIELASSTNYADSRFVGMLSNDIADGATGEAVLFGPVTGLNTGGLSVGPAYLSTDGNLTSTRPTGALFNVVVGFVAVVDATTGVIVMDSTISELTAEVTDTNGFTPDQRTATTLTFVDGTRLFTIAPTGSDFHFYQNGVKYDKTTSQTVTVPDAEGLYAIYFDNGILTQELMTSDHQITTTIETKCVVSYIYWDATNSKNVYFADERHGVSMSPVTHSYLHNTRGALFQHGYGLDGFVIDDSGNDAEDAQFSVAGGVMVDEDISTTATGVASTVGLPIYYLEGAELKRFQTNAGFSVLTAGTGRLAYNLNTAGTWSLAEVANSDFVLYHIFAVNAYTEQFKIVSVVGQNQYPNAGAARTGAASEISNLASVLLTAEVVPIGTVIFQTRDNYSNAVKARIRSTDEGDNYIDWRTTELAQGVNPSSHANLTNLELAQVGVTNGHINDQAQTIAGIKTFSDKIGVDGATNLTHGLNVATSLKVGNTTAGAVTLTSNASNTGLITANNLSPADPNLTSTMSEGANFGFNGAASNFYGMGLGVIRDSGYDIWFTTGANNGGGFRFYNRSIEVVTINKAGNVGIGTINPIEDLDIDGKTGSSFMRMCNNNTGRLDNEGLYVGVAGTSGEGYIGTRHNKALHFRTNQTDALFIDTNQNVGIGTTSPDGILDTTPDTIGVTSYSYGTRVTTIQMNALTGMTDGAEVYNLTTHSKFLYDGNLTAWVEENPQFRTIGTEITGTSYTFALADSNKFILATNASSQNLTVPPNANVAFDIGSEIEILRNGAGQVSFVEGSGVTINSKDSLLNIADRYTCAVLKKIATDVWILIGGLS